MTSKQLYKGLNRRFDKRVVTLAEAGFKTFMSDAGFYFARRRFGEWQVIPHTFVMHAHNICWFDRLAEILERA